MNGAPCRVSILAIGSSTGGPQALWDLLRALPPDLCLPVVITQHITPQFTRPLCHRLTERTSFVVQEAESGAPLEPNRVWIAPPGRHLVIKRSALPALELNDEPPENSCKPSVDVLFRSVARAFGPAALGVVLTGMGKDGLEGAREINRCGGAVLAQDQASSVVWGMPGLVVKEGLAAVVAPPRALAREIQARVQRSRAR